MAHWDFHEIFPCFDFRKIDGYPNHIPLAWKENVPKFDNEPLHATQHILSFLEYVWKLGVVHEDILIMLFFVSLDGRKKAWVRNGISPGSISSCVCFFLLIYSFNL
jgi:hypothetical protein